VAEDDKKDRDARRSRAQRIRARIQSLVSKKTGGEPAANTPKSPRDFIEEKMRDADRSRGSKGESRKRE
jgi:hypothetical protein